MKPKMRKLTKDEIKEYIEKMARAAGTPAWNQAFLNSRSWMNQPTFQISKFNPKKVIKKSLRESLLQGGGNPIFIVDKEG